MIILFVMKIYVETHFSSSAAVHKTPRKISFNNLQVITPDVETKNDSKKLANRKTGRPKITKPSRQITN